jgi:hypothetical protein
MSAMPAAQRTTAEDDPAQPREPRKRGPRGVS